jgi:ankyrin repeat protein
MSFETQFPNEDKLIKYIDENKPLNTIDLNGDSLLIFACTKKYTDAALKILQHDANDINLSYSSIYSNTTALLEACKNGLTDVIDRMFDFKSNEIELNYIGDDYNSAINLLCNNNFNLMSENDRTVIVQKMINKYSNELILSKQNDNGDTPLMISIKSKLIYIVHEMLDKFNSEQLSLNAINRKGDDAEALAEEEGLEDILMSIRLLSRRSENNDISSIPSSAPTLATPPDSPESSAPTTPNSPFDFEFNQGSAPQIQKYEKQIIDLNKEAYDPINMSNEKIYDYLNEDHNNIVIKMEDNYYLSSRSNLKRQIDDSIVFECIEADIKRPDNIIGNLPLYNLKMIGINVDTDKVGIIPEYIYYYSMYDLNNIDDNGIDYIINSNDQLFSVIPLHDKMLVSVISLNEINNLGRGFSSSSAVHCQAGQGGLSGIIVKAYSVNKNIGGKLKKTVKNIKRKNKHKTNKFKKNNKKSKSIKKIKIKNNKKRNTIRNKKLNKW